MGISQLFRAGITVPACDQGKLVTDRVACRYETRVLHKTLKDVQATRRVQQYRQTIINTLRSATTDDNTGLQLVRRFVYMAETLEINKAVAINSEESQDDAPNGNTLIGAYAEVMNESSLSGYTSLAYKTELLQNASVNQALLHPLFVALIAYRMGGPIVADAAYAHKWKAPEGSATTGVQAFHMEGDSGDAFDHHRITVVWEIRDGKPSSPSGTHHIFLAGDATPHPLAALRHLGQETLMTVIYNSQSAALYYDCQNPGVVRNSITLDFHVNVVTNDDLNMISVDAVKQDHLNLTQLLTNFPIHDYDAHFHRLLFDPNSLSAIFSKLLSLNISISPPTPPPTPTKTSLEQRFDAYMKENHACIPPEILDLEHDIPISGNYDSPSSLLDRICLKARRDVHLNLGIDLFPQVPVAEQQEWARKYIRDLPREIIFQRLAQYLQIITQCPFTNNDLVPVRQLKPLASHIEMRCFELISTGFIDDMSLLPSIASFAAAIGSALDGPKEAQVVPDPWIQDADLQIFRTRCLYLFWCADWLARYLVRPVQGAIMTMEVRQQDLAGVRREIILMAQALLRNWLAWGLFVDGLPNRPFIVRRPSALG
ncbi:hypothetical protein P153DRAFT_399929 [Dothidotthia symphoricarpi CBS 119687]|uniref:Uncharacterized protein n=1 Tax=Dothidotthia symphoricarpi CBS 119687 TaxID=1392245 RepID=A0A6A6A1S0_9PLEO|nr:uncharacterized protein P153DRAFT_399929 [Dothidotthia symphoricarpi CBS 119687]KAF2125789.1 hypothetical protein P153DRAFT_399929 [Dothidotthia symphoricarpi CBS 119687]